MVRPKQYRIGFVEIHQTVCCQIKRFERHIMHICRRCKGVCHGDIPSQIHQGEARAQLIPKFGIIRQGRWRQVMSCQRGESMCSGGAGSRIGSSADNRRSCIMRQILRHHAVIASRTACPGLLKVCKIPIGVMCLGEGAVLDD